jgi:hypothetical protein
MNKPALRVEYVVTADDPYGEPWPPDGNCSLVRRAANGFSLWRRLRLAEHRAVDRRQAARRYEQLQQSRQPKP